MNQSIAKLPKGVRYFYGEEVKRRRAIEQSVLAVFHGWSYQEIILPIFDYHRLFALGLGTDIAERTYRFIDPDGELLALRPDLTSLVARTVATRFTGAPRPIRLCYSGEVFRYKEAHEQRPHDFHQLGLEHIGSDRLEADLEILLIAIEALATLGLKDCKIVLSQVNFINGIFELLKLGDDERQRLLGIIDSRNSVALNNFLRESMVEADRVRLCRLITTIGGREIIELAEQFHHDKIAAALADLAGIWQIAEAVGIAKMIEIDLGDVHGLDYYTGMTFKIYHPGIGGAIGSGGRYDGLLCNFGADEPAVGFQLSLDLLNRVAEIDTTSERATRILASQDLVQVFQQAQQARARQAQVEITADIHD